MFLAVEVAERQPARLRDPRPGGVEQFEQGAVAQAGGSVVGRGGEQGSDLVLRQRVGDAGGHPDAFDVGGRVVAPHAFLGQEAVQHPDRGDLAGDRCGGRA